MDSLFITRAVVLLLAVYFLFIKTKFDFSTLWYFASVFYFSPTLMGLTFDIQNGLYSGFLTPSQPLIYVTLIHFLFVGMCGPMCSIIVEEHSKEMHLRRQTVRFLGACALILFSVVVVTTPQLFTGGSKSDLMEESGAAYTAFIYIATIYGVYYVSTINRLMIIDHLLFFSCTFGALLINKRSHLVFIAATYALQKIVFSKTRVVFTWKKISLAVLFFAFALIAKPLFGMLRGSLSGNSAWGIDNYLVVLSGLDAFSTQALLDFVLRNDIHIRGDYLLYSPWVLLLPGGFIGVSSAHFNEAIQGVYFPNLKYGLSYNPYGEGYAVMGWIGIFAVASIWGAAVIWINWVASRISGSVRGVIMFMGFLIAFYLHRNSALSEITYIRNYLHIILFFELLVLFVSLCSAGEKMFKKSASEGDAKT